MWVRTSVVALAALVCTGAAHAQAGAALCGRISSSREQMECTTAVAEQYVDPAAVALCGRISGDREIVECARAVAGQTLDAGAVRSCGRISSNREIAECGRAIAGKTYGQEELRLCDRSPSNDAIVQCMRSTGRSAAPAYGYGYQVWVTFDNRLAADPVVRLYYRAAGQRGGWSQNVLRTAISPGQRYQFLIPAGSWDLCAELADGTSAWWSNRPITANDYIFTDGDKYDPMKYALRSPCRRRDRAY
jgi:hypothetical protein